jgi:hypothetical protein
MRVQREGQFRMSPLPSFPRPQRFAVRTPLLFFRNARRCRFLDRRDRKLFFGANCPFCRPTRIMSFWLKPVAVCRRSAFVRLTLVRKHPMPVFGITWPTIPSSCWLIAWTWLNSPGLGLNATTYRHNHPQADRPYQSCGHAYLQILETAPRPHFRYVRLRQPWAGPQKLAGLASIQARLLAWDCRLDLCPAQLTQARPLVKVCQEKYIRFMSSKTR